jgi:hypothetical protein
MPRCLPRTVRDQLEKAQSAALAAVEAYNKPGPRFRTAHFVILMILAWAALFHAIFYRQGEKPWYRKRRMRRAIRYERVDGEPKHWELAECLKQYYQSDNPPERENLRFLLGLRNKIEHRHLPQLDPALYGECQAALMNFEDLLVNQFGPQYALNESLAVSLQFSRAIPDAKAAAVRKLAASQAKGVVDYIEKFRGGLPADVLESTKYSFSVYLIPKIANRRSAADIAVEFVHYDSANTEEAENLRKIIAMIREKQVPVANVNFMRPGQVVEAVQECLNFPFKMHHHTRAWKYYEIRPNSGSPKPEKTQSEYCVYDKAHRDYLYTPAWVTFLVRELSKPMKYEEVTGAVGSLTREIPNHENPDLRSQ